MSTHMPFVWDDGGRKAAGFAGQAGDCVARSISIASGLPYAEVYSALCAVNGNARSRYSKTAGRKSARNGVLVRSVGFKRYMASIGFTWTPTMGIGTGAKVHLTTGELPGGRLVVAVSKHYTAVIDGTIHDIYSPEREIHCFTPERGNHIQRRCVYGYWTFNGKP